MLGPGWRRPSPSAAWARVGADLSFQVCVAKIAVILRFTSLGLLQTEAYTCSMPLYHRYFKPGQLQFVTSSTYRRVPVFLNPEYRKIFVDSLRAVRSKLDFLLIGWVLMPEHFHVLLRPGISESTSNIVKELKQRSAAAVLQTLRTQDDAPSSRALLRSFRLPSTVHDQTHYRVWQRRFVPFNVYTEKKRLEKLDYMHGNPVKRGLVPSPDEWAWSSWRFYYLGDRSVLEMDRLG
jgi:putative transposase